MSFNPDWLRMRFPADLRSRNLDVVRALADHAKALSAVVERPLQILDIGAGTGNNMRATAAHVAVEQEWRLVDLDAGLLDHATPPKGVKVTKQTADLAREIRELVQPGIDLVTASAFFDLCGALWLERFVDALEMSGAAFYTVLTYDGREEWSPASPLDEPVLAAFHEDQTRDKGFGPSLGPGAHAYLADILRSRGYRVVEGSSDWDLGEADRMLIETLAQGTADAVRPALGSSADEWLASRRLADRAIIGHKDLLALPPVE